MDSERKILDGVKVLDLTRFLSGPQATLFLAALGADVVRIDDPDRGDPAASAPPYIGPHGISMTRQSPDDLGIAYLKRGRGKKSVLIDLKCSDGLQLFLRMVEKADVLVENFRVGVTKRLGIDYPALHALNPKLIYCSITGYGATGPESNRKAYDLMIQASSGLMSITGEPAGSPQKAGSPISDGIAGTFAVSGILGALYQRTNTGKGQFIDVSMADCLVSLMLDEPWDCYEALGLPFRQGNRIMRFSPFNTYPAFDGTVALGAATQDDWVNLLDLMDQNDLKGSADFMDPGWRISNNADVDAIVTNWTKSHTVNDIVAWCTARSIACSPLREIANLANWEQLQHRDLLTTAEHPGLPGQKGPAASAFPLKFSGADTHLQSPAALHGEHTDEVLRAWLGETSQDPRGTA